MTQFIDRRQNSKKKSTINRQRFIRRFKQQIKEAVAQSMHKRSITNINMGEKIIIPRKDIKEPAFGFGKGGKKEHVLPGNKNFVTGDKIKRQEKKQGSGGDGEASNHGEGLDDFVFELTKEEFLELFFEDLALPDLVKTQLVKEPTLERVRAGFSTVGTPPNIHLVRSFRNAIARRLAFSVSYKKQLAASETALNTLLESEFPDNEQIIALEKKIEKIKLKASKIPFLDTFDIRYITQVRRPKISTQAVMFCVMDVSGSMDETKKEIAKKFFILLYLFLTKTYQKIKIIFIRHHTTAKEVNEEEFFYSRETGGTVVSSALDLVHQLILERFPTTDWNIYIAQASDGDNWNADSPKCQEILAKSIMPYIQYFAYVEIMPRHHQSLWRSYIAIKEKYKNFSMRNINEPKDIYPVFRDLFKRKVG